MMYERCYVIEEYYALVNFELFRYISLISKYK